jgi:hypothetical protein
MKTKRKDRTGAIFSSVLTIAFGLLVITLIVATLRQNFDIRSKASTSDIYPFGKSYMLSTYSNLRLKVGTALNSPAFTIEGWFKAGNPSSPGYLFNKRYPLTDKPTDYRSTFNIKLGVFEKGTDINATVMLTGALQTTVDTHVTPLSDGKWHHIAFVHKKSGTPCMKLFVDGAYIGNGFGCGTRMDAGGDLLIGTGIDTCTAYGCTYKSFNQLYVDEVRISKIERYTGNFPVQKTPFTPDINTLALLHFDGTLTDASSHFPDATSSYGIYDDSTIVINPTPTPTVTPIVTPIPEYVQTINLSTGWNWITLLVSKPNMEVSSVLSSIAGKYDQVLSENSIYTSWIDPNFNTLKTLSSGHMYLVHMTEPGTLTVNGTRISPTQPITLHKGVNWIGYYGTTAMPVAQALSSIAQTYQRVISEDLYYDPVNTQISSLQSFEPNQGYMLYSIGDQTLTYPQTADPTTPQTQLTNTVITQQYTNVYGKITLPTNTIPSQNGLIVAEFLTPSGIVAGTGIIKNNILTISRLFGAETINGKQYAGFQPGEVVKVRVKDYATKKEIGTYTTDFKFTADDSTHLITVYTPSITPQLSPKISPKPCIPEPVCLKAKIPCKIKEPAGGWCPTL